MRSGQAEGWRASGVWPRRAGGKQEDRQGVNNRRGFFQDDGVPSWGRRRRQRQQRQQDHERARERG